MSSLIAKKKKKPNLAFVAHHDLLTMSSMANKYSSTTVVMPPRRTIVLIGTNDSPTLIALNINAHALLKLTTTNYFAWQLQFTSLLFEYNLLGFIHGSKPCPSALITLPDVASPSPNPNHIPWLRQDQLLLNAIVRFVSTTLV